MRRAALALLAAAAAAAAAPAAASALGRLAPCADRPDVDCTSVVVPLDRSGAVPGSISLHVERWTARPARGTVFLLAGGPGQASTRTFDVGNRFWQELFPGYTLVAFDPRGTGRSGALDCPELAVAQPPAGEPPLAACARRLGGTRRLYTTAETAHDLDAVRAALGLQTVALAGVSYGTKVALAYAAAYPGRVERLVLDSVVPLDGPDPFALSTLRSVPATARSMCAARACRGATRDFGAEVVTLANRIGDAPLRGPVLDADGRLRTTEVWGVDVLHLLVRADSDPGVRALLPPAVNAAVGGRPRALLRLARMLRTSEPPPEIEVFTPAGLAATLCSDIAVPWARQAPAEARRAVFDATVAALPPGATGRLRSWAAGFGPGRWCLDWPDSGTQPPAPPLPDVPLLALAGEVDLRTPPADARALAARVARGRVLLARGVGHAVLFTSAHACARAAIAQWLAGRVPRGECARRAPEIPTVPRAPATFGAFAASSGSAVRLRRTLAAVRATVAEARASYRIALGQSRWGARSVVLPGVRSGRLALPVGGGRAVLTRYAYAPGVTLTGTLAAGSDREAARLSGALRVCGGDAARGVLVVSAGRAVRGTLGGRRFGPRGRLPAVPRCG